MTNVTRNHVTKEVEDVLRKTKWLKPDVAMDVLRLAYQREQRRYRETLVARENVGR